MPNMSENSVNTRAARADEWEEIHEKGKDELCKALQAIVRMLAFIGSEIASRCRIFSRGAR